MFNFMYMIVLVYFTSLDRLLILIEYFKLR